MQRTLVELGFLPVAYVPALVFHHVERLDVVKMVRLLIPPAVPTDAFPPRTRALADRVLRPFRNRSVLPQIAEAVQELSLFAGLDQEQVNRLAGVCGVSTFETGEVIFREGEQSNGMHLVLQGQVGVAVAKSASAVGTVRKGECLGEISLLTHDCHSATATALTTVETAVLEHRDLVELIRLRPDIGLHIFRNLATGLGEKLKRTSLSLPI
jgi:CRP-like cAMP-binding protein